MFTTHSKDSGIAFIFTENHNFSLIDIFEYSNNLLKPREIIFNY